MGKKRKHRRVNYRKVSPEREALMHSIGSVLHVFLGGIIGGITFDFTEVKKEPDIIDTDYIELPNDQKLLGDGKTD